MKSRIAIAVLLITLATGCTSFDPRSQANADKQIRANLVKQLETLPGLTVTASIESSLAGGQNNLGAAARVPASTTVARMNVVADTLERIVWLSHLNPLGTISIDVRRQGSSVSAVQRSYYIEEDTRKLRAKYGPRPDGLPG
jgi:hypothetical protein